jgi:speckle-type POZ protein
MSRVGDGCFTIRCVLTVRKESPPLELPVHLERMLGDGRGADVTFSVGGEEFCAHRSLLAARSPIFAAQLFGPMAEKDMRHVEVMDMEPTIFEMMLHYIYTDSMPPRSDDDGGGYDAPVMQHLLVAADRYAIDRLKHMCEEELCKRMDAETVTNTLALADQHQCERLKKACVAFMASAKVMAAVVETHGFKKHLKTCSRPLSLEGIPNEKRQPSIRRKYLLRSRPLSVEGIPQGGKEKRQPSIQRKYLLRSRPLSLKRKYFLRSLKQDI